MSTALPLVSIALTTYNGARYLDAQMESLLAQTYPHIEIVVSDDGSTDDTCARLAAYAARDSRVRVLDTGGNLGFNGNFARCFAACRGELISPCDQDDVWHHEKTQLLVQALGDAMLVYANSRFVDGEGRPLQRCMSDGVHMASGDDPRVFLFGNSVSGHAMVFRRTLLAAAGAFPATIYFDWWLAFVAANVGRIAYLDVILVDYRRHAQAITCRPNTQGSASRRLATLRTHAQRFAAMADYPGPQQAYIRQLQSHWLAWYQGLLNWSLFWFVLPDRAVLLYTVRTRWPQWQILSKYLIGHRLKRMLMPNHYLPLHIPKTGSHDASNG